jgi:hypothetical protein
MVADCLDRRGAAGAAKALGVSRGTVLAVVAGQPVVAGTLALLYAAKNRREAA